MKCLCWVHFLFSMHTSNNKVWPQADRVMALVRGDRQCNFGFLLSLARTLGLKQNVCCVTTSISGLLSAVAVISLVWQTPLLKSPKSECCWQSGGRVAMHFYVWQHVQLWGNGCTRYLLTQYWVNFRVKAEERQQKLTQRTNNRSSQSKHECTF